MTTERNAAGIEATSQELENGKFLHIVTENGIEVARRTSLKRYLWIWVQRWEGKEEWAPRYSMDSKKLGSRIEYGYCAGNVPIHPQP